jgi:hypothetical protein
MNPVHCRFGIYFDPHSMFILFEKATIGPGATGKPTTSCILRAFAQLETAAIVSRNTFRFTSHLQVGNDIKLAVYTLEVPANRN